MTSSLALLAAALLAAQPADPGPSRPNLPPPSSSTLPPNHPPLDAAPPTRPPAGQGSPGQGMDAPRAPLPPDHPPISGSGRTPSAEELLEQLDRTPGLKEKEKTFEVAASLARLYYGAGRFADALALLAQAEEKARPLRDVFLAQRKKLGRRPVPEVSGVQCGYPDAAPMEAKTFGVEQLAKKGNAASAAACARAALEPLLDVEMMRGHALFLGGDGPGALEAYERVLDVAPSHEEALFARASVLFETRGDDVKALRAAQDAFEAFVLAHPESGRAGRARQLAERAGQEAEAGGRTKLAARSAEQRQAAGGAQAPAATTTPPPAAGGELPQVSGETMRAIQQTEVTPEMRQRFAQLQEEGEEHLARGRFQEAREAYRQVMPYEPSPRVQAGLAWALIGLGLPNGQRVWDVAVKGDPAAVERLGDTLKAKNDDKGARALWARLAETAPDYAGKSGLQAKLR